MSPQGLLGHRIVTVINLTHCVNWPVTVYLGSEIICTSMLFDFCFICLIAMKSLLFANDLSSDIR